MVKCVPQVKSERFRPQWGRGASGLLGAMILWLATATSLHATSFTASLDHDTMIVGETATLTLSFQDGSPSAIPAPPSVPNLLIQDTGASGISFNEINGVQSRIWTHNFIVKGLQPGDYTIPSMSVTIDGQLYRSQPVKLSVTKTPPAPEGIDPANPDIAFMRLAVPKKTVYVGEMFRAELQLYLREGIVRITDVQPSPAQGEGFTVGKSQEGSHRQARIGNSGYSVIPVNMVFTAAKAGRITFEPMEYSMNLLFGPIDFFGRPTRMQHVALSNLPVTIQALPLPTNNVPPGFNGAVGNYSLAVNVSPTNVAVGDPVNVKVEITGSGALENVALPTQTGWQQFKLYPPTSEVHADDQLGMSGTKSFALTAVPENMDVRELPPFAFSYFDPDQKTYRTLSHPAVPLTIRPSAASLPPPTFSSGNVSDNPPPVRDVVPIKQRLGTLATISPPLIQQPWFLALQAIPAVAWLALLFNRKQRERLANNPRLRRQKQVEQTIRTDLHNLRRFADANQPADFFATIFHLLQERLGERLDLPASAITEAVLDERLRPIGVSDDQLAALHELFQTCNQARYAPDTTHEELLSLIPKVESALNDLKKVNA